MANEGNDIRKLSPAKMATLLNSAMFGEVTSGRQVQRHRERAGTRIGDGRTIDLIRYVGWLCDVWEAKPTEEEEYLARKERRRAQKQEQATAARDIGDIPEIENPERRKSTESSFKEFCEVYFKEIFYLPWSDDHLRVIDRIEKSVLRGGLFAMAMPRGTGKTTLCECACMWATLNGASQFVALIGSDEAHAAGMLDSIKTQLQENDLLFEDFPEAIYPIRCLEGISNRAGGQMYNGKNTRIEWKQKVVVLPTIAGSIASGAIINVSGITGRVRGMKFTRPDQRVVRPSLVIVDDPQTDESARSVSQSQNREAILAGAVLGLAGPGKKIAGIMPCTVIHPGDMADNILDREKHPEWGGERTKMVYSFPENEKLWEQYDKIRRTSYREGNEGADATQFYIANRLEMDVGSKVAWEARYNHDEASAIQHAMNLRFRDEAAFYSEYQNEPLVRDDTEDKLMEVDAIASKLNNVPRGRVPVGVTKLTMMVDVQKKLLWYVIIAWEDDFTGYVIDFGSWPDQKKAYYTLRNARIGFAHKFPKMGLEGSIYAALEKLVDGFLVHDFVREDGGEARIDRCMIDANWGDSTEVVYQFCRQSTHSAIITPSHGFGITASARPMNEVPKKRGEVRGLNWYMPPPKVHRKIKHVNYDTNFWKSFVHHRLNVSMGDPGCLSLFGNDPSVHRMFAEQLTAEYRIRTQGRGRTVDEWKQLPTRPDNHFLDCVAGAAVAASISGVSLEELEQRKPTKSRGSLNGMTMAEMRAKNQWKRRAG